MRRCPQCFAVYDDRTGRCAPCGLPTEAHEDRRREVSPPAAPEETVILAEADPEWAERARAALSVAGVASRLEASPHHSARVELRVAPADLGRAVDIVGDAMDEPPEVAGDPGDAGGAVETLVLDEEEPEDGASPDPSAGGPTAPEEDPHPDQASRCPACGEAYRSGFDLCADCGVPLVPAGAPETPRRRR